MAVRIRLARRGRKKLAMYDVVVADARAPRDGRFIEKLGTYNPNTHPATVVLNDDRAFHWVMNGALPTDTVKGMLSQRGVMLRKHLQVGVIKGAISQDDADRKLMEWLKGKDEKFQATVDKIQQDKQSSTKARLEAEAKIKEARAEAIAKKNIVEEAPSEEAPVEEATPEGTAQDEPSAEAPSSGEADSAQTGEAKEN